MIPRLARSLDHVPPARPAVRARRTDDEQLPRRHAHPGHPPFRERGRRRAHRRTLCCRNRRGLVGAHPRRVTACDPPRGFTFVAQKPDQAVEDTFEVTLIADGDQTVLVYEHRGVPLDLLFAYGAGEQIHVEDLGAHLAGRERDTDEARWTALESAYREPAEKIGPQR